MASLKHTTTFFGQLLRNPKRISAVAPSSSGLAQQMVSQITPQTRQVVELGPGTGKITGFILKAGITPQNLTVLEMNPQFCALLRDHFPQTNIVEGDAQDIAKTGLEAVDMVISGLPLLSIPVEVQKNIVTGAFDLLQPGGKYVQFTYGPKPPIAAEILECLGLEWKTLPKIWRNLPPATTYVFTRP